MGVDVEVRNEIAEVVLNWPEKRNALGLEQIPEVTDALEAAVSSGAKVIVLSGNGAFCAGANLNNVARHADRHTDPGEIESVPQSLVRTVVGLPIPILAALDGPAIGFGMDLALACDQCILGPQGWMLQGWGRIGVIPGTGGILLLRLRNETVMWTLLAEQTPIRGADAERWGIGEWSRYDSAVTAARARAQAIAEMPIEAIHAYVELSREHVRAQLPLHLVRSAALQAELLARPELADRINAD